MADRNNTRTVEQYVVVREIAHVEPVAQSAEICRQIASAGIS
jgi:hypothetical protein